MDADSAVTSWFPEGEALEISKRSSPGGRRTLSPHRRTLQGSEGLASTTAAAFWVSRHPPPAELLLVVPPTKHVILGLSDFFLMTLMLRFPVIRRGWPGKGEQEALALAPVAGPRRVSHIRPLILPTAACLPRGCADGGGSRSQPRIEACR